MIPASYQSDILGTFTALAGSALPIINISANTNPLPSSYLPTLLVFLIYF
jgi:hypothetical protein